MRIGANEVEITLLEGDAKPEAPVYLALPMWALMLLVYERHFKWPAREFVEAIAEVLNPGD